MTEPGGNNGRAGSEPLDLLAVGAHPDDAEIGCGGALLRAEAAGLRVGIADLSAGERSTAGTQEQRMAERDRASAILGLTTRVVVGLPDTAIGTTVDQRDAVVATLRSLRPRVVLAPYPEDRHPDHAAAGRLVREAVFYAGVPAVGTGPAHRPHRLYHYPIHRPFLPSFVVDVTAVWERKMAAVHAYRSQFGDVAAPRTELPGGFLDAVESMAAFHGAMAGVARAEAFTCAGPLLLPGFPELAATAAREETAPYRMFR